jgi:hypothetical protein
VNEPTRLRDEPHSALERSLLEAGRSYKASASTRRQALAVLGVAGATATSAAAATTLTKAGLAKWAVGLAVAGGAVVSAAHYFAQLRPSSSVAPSVLSPSTAKASPAPLAAAASVPAPEEAVPSVSAGPVASVTGLRAEPKAALQSPLAAELSALDAARTSLSEGDAKGALTELDAYSRAFPRGKLALEAEVLRIGALAKSGQNSAARQRAEAFVKRHPDSVLASRVRGYVGL